jgi:hypothetical protein
MPSYTPAQNRDRGSKATVFFPPESASSFFAQARVSRKEGEDNDTVNAGGIVYGVFHRFRGGTSSRHVREQGRRKRRQGARRGGENELSDEV